MNRFLIPLMILFTLGAQGSEVKWQPWSDSLFEKAKAEKKLVVLDLQAVWCHWCHVMENETYKDPTVKDLLTDSYIATRVDQDSRPDISSRYEDYGWPATIIFNSDGKEIVKRSGFIPPEKMAKILADAANQPNQVMDQDDGAEEKISSGNRVLTQDLEKDLNSTLQARYDEENGGWDISHKFVDPSLIEILLLRDRSSRSGKEGYVYIKKARQTLDHGLKLLDPVWGGFYEYSTGANWNEPHFEKIISVQMDMLKAYSLAYEQLEDKKYLDAAIEVYRYLKTFLKSPSGGFYTSQDADVVQGQVADEYFKLLNADRRKKGIPKVDRHRYTRENGWVIQGLLALYSATGDNAYLSEALNTAQWIKKNRTRDGGGYSHGANGATEGGPYLIDNLSAAQAFLGLYSATSDRQWLKNAEDTMHFINSNFKDKSAGFISAISKSKIIPSTPDGKENIELGRLSNLLFHYTGNKLYSEMATQAMSYVSQPQLAQNVFFVPGILLFQREISTAPIHVTIVGQKDDSAAQALLKAALKFPATYKRVELWDKRDGPLPQSDVTYPDIKTAAAFACADNRCGLPAVKPEDVTKQIVKVIGE